MRPRPWIILTAMAPIWGCAAVEVPLESSDTGSLNSGLVVVQPPTKDSSVLTADTAQGEVEFDGPTLVARATAQPSVGPAPLTVYFGATDSTGSSDRAQWSFGDGAEAVGERVRHTYTRSGSYTAKVQLEDRFGQFSQAVVPVQVDPPICPNVGEHQVLGNVQYEGIDEASGLVDSRQNPGVLWVHNDSGDGPSLYALTHSGEHLGVWELEDGSARDWEDLAIGQCWFLFLW